MCSDTSHDSASYGGVKNEKKNVQKKNLATQYIYVYTGIYQYILVYTKYVQNQGHQGPNFFHAFKLVFIV
jgi:hypothetical protein